jgi:hypothetical protein
MYSLRSTLEVGHAEKKPFFRECDPPRFKGQIEATVRQFAEVTGVSILLNDRPIDEALSLQG